MAKFCINTAIPYVNAIPHIGHALELIGADVIARRHRIIGDDVLFGTGTDEHGSKLAETAAELGVEPQILCDKNSRKFKALKKELSLSFDVFWRTTDPQHKEAVAKIWEKLVKSGDVYKKAYQALYCVGCESFLTKSELIDGKCPAHDVEPKVIDEENYFFRLSKYSPAIQKHFEKHFQFVCPKKRYNEIYKLIKSGLEDISISRHISKLSWGVPVPGDPEQVMYVWVDALSNYITMLGYGWDEKKLRKWWPTDINVIGKDIIRHHAAIWPGILMSIGEELPKQVFVHGFITSGGKKMSKTLGNVIDPLEMNETFGIDAFRYLLLRTVPFDDDGDVTKDGLLKRYESDLSNSLGNLVNRVLKMCERYFGDGPNFKATKLKLLWQKRIDDTWKKYNEHMDEFRFHLVLDAVMNCIGELNAAVDEEKPWELAKNNKERLEQVLYALLESLRHVGLWLAPFMPDKMALLYEALGLKLKENYSVKEHDKLQEWGGEKIGKIIVIKPLFPRLEE